jgi:hypothetical protein
MTEHQVTSTTNQATNTAGGMTVVNLWSLPAAAREGRTAALTKPTARRQKRGISVLAQTVLAHQPPRILLGIATLPMPLPACFLTGSNLLLVRHPVGFIPFKFKLVILRPVTPSLRIQPLSAA